MGTRPNVLLTNDDGLGAPGLEALEELLSSVADVTTIAPATNRSGAGRAHSRNFTVTERDSGIQVDGTPCDCVIYGIEGLDETFDLVVSGCNDGPNIGEVKIHRSRTISAAAEAVYLDTPAISASLYDPAYPVTQEFAPEDFSRGVAPIEYLVSNLDRILPEEPTAYLNVNLPSVPTDQIRLTQPLSRYDVSITEEAGEISVKKGWYDPLLADHSAEVLAEIDEHYTDRRALADGVVSVSPLVNQHSVDAPANTEEMLNAYDPG